MNSTTHANTIETIRSENIGTLNELVDITRDGAIFFGDAAKHVDNPKLKTMFTEMTDTKMRLADEMSRELKSAPAKPAAATNARTTWKKLYSDIRGKLGDKTFGFASDLQASEDRLLKAFDNVTRDGEVSVAVKQVVSSYLPAMRKQYDLIRERHWAAAA